MGEGLTENQKILAREFGAVAREYGIDDDLIFLAGAIAFGKDTIGKEEEIMKDLIDAVKKYKNNQNFLDYMDETYVQKMRN